MDDELKAIQADLDSVLHRLEAYLAKGEAPQFSAIECHYESTGELLSSLVGTYTMQNTATRRLDNALSATLGAIDSVERNRLALAESFNSQKAINFLSALDAIILAQRLSVPLRKKYMEALIQPIGRYKNQQDHYLGESSGLPRYKRINSNQEAKKHAAFLVYTLHKSDPEQYPLGPTTWESVSKSVHLSPSTVRNAYYESSWPTAMEFERKK
ncbi:hypothetical protein [Vreelandella stevensii]|uniref:hypothetical protein n=1 Tax=Vreelandella stevensii TaxID=502821 RepID=UPI00403A9ADA